MGTKATVNEMSMVFGGGKFVDFVGDDIKIEAVENGFTVDVTEDVGKGDEREIRHRHYVFNRADELLDSLRFWTQRMGVQNDNG